MPKLAGKKALVTGAARGIGAAIAQAFRSEGCDVIVTDIDVQTGQAFADEIGATFIALDVASETDWNAVAKKVPALDILVNNAGITGFEGPFDGPPP
jgi:3(or 17)beta-hydroxysteroid dehydrogenase